MDNYQIITNKIKELKYFLKIFNPLVNNNIKIIIVEISKVKFYKIIYFFDKLTRVDVEIYIINYGNTMYSTRVASIIF